MTESELSRLEAMAAVSPEGPWHEVVSALTKAVRERDDVIARFAQDESAYLLGERAGVAKALAVLRRVLDEYPIRSEALAKAVGAVERERGPGEALPHERVRSRLAKLERALRAMLADTADGGPASAADCRAIAREALEEGA